VICGVCEKTMRSRWVLYDREQTLAGVYCSKACAESDAWGPRFSRYSVGQASARVLAALEAE
jgi:hypothetical protein